MKSLFLSAIGGALLLSASVASAQFTPRVYDRGSVWTASYIQTKPGQFNAFMADLGKNWRAAREQAQKRGDEISYKILNIADARDGEANLVLMVEYKNWATRDRSLADNEADTKALFGSLDANRQMGLDREALRTQRGSRASVELKFVK